MPVSVDNKSNEDLSFSYCLISCFPSKAGNDRFLATSSPIIRAIKMLNCCCGASVAAVHNLNIKER